MGILDAPVIPKDSTGRRLDSFPAISADEAIARFVPSSKLRSAVLNSQLANANTNPFPDPMASPPTMTGGTASTVTGHSISPLSDEVTLVGLAPNWDASFGAMTTPYCGAFDFFHVGDTLELHGRSASNGVERVWLWVDGVPATAAPVASGVTSSAGSSIFIKWVFGSSARRRITLFVDSFNGVFALNVPVTTLVTPAPRQLVGAFNGDSFFAGAAGVGGLQTAPIGIGRALGIAAAPRARGGTGYVTAVSGDTFGAAARVAAIAAAKPDFIVISGSVNDGQSGATIQAAATATYAALAVACPGVPIIVFGPQPSNAVDTLSATRQAANAAVRAAALAAPNVIAFYDMIGHATGSVAAYSASTTYTTGQRVSYLGAIWEAQNGSASFSGNTPGSTRRWKLVTWLYFGTGNASSPAGDGTRDLFLTGTYNSVTDNLHPTLEGHRALTIRQSAAIREALLAFVLA